MKYENFGTELQVRELMRRCLYLDTSIYSNTKPSPPYTRKPWWFENSSAQINVTLEPIAEVAVMRRNKVSASRVFHVTLQLNGIQNKAVENGSVNTQIKLITNKGRRVQWTLSEVAAFLARATFPSWFTVSINIQWGEFFASRWNSARSNKLATAFDALDAVAFETLATEYRDKAAMIVNEDSERTQNYLDYAGALESAALFQAAIESNNFEIE